MLNKKKISEMRREKKKKFIGIKKFTKKNNIQTFITQNIHDKNSFKFLACLPEKSRSSSFRLK